MNEKIRYAVILGVVSIGSIVAGVQLRQFLEPGEDALTEAQVLGQPAAVALPSHLDAFELSDVNGVTRHLDEWSNQILVINFWATWCEPCREEMPLLQALRDDFVDDGVEFLGIAVDDLDAVRRFVDEIGIEYPSLVVGRDAGFELLEAHNPQGVLPFSLIVQPDRRIHRRKIGVWSRQELVQAIADARP